jgi:FkbM family methyltransferase
MEAQIRFIDKGHISETISKGQVFMEQDMLEQIAKLPYRPGLWLDIGAHVGNHTVFFSKYCIADEIWAYEPNDDAFEVLIENTSKNDCNNVLLLNAAVGDKVGKVQLVRNAERPAQSKVRNAKGKTPLVIIGDIAAKVALVKIDVEGFELEVLRGSMPMLERDKPELFIETFEHLEAIVNMLPEGYVMVQRYNNAPTYHFTYLNGIDVKGAVLV